MLRHVTPVRNFFLRGLPGSRGGPVNASKLLIDEHPLQVLPSLACKIGLNQAIVLQQVHYWLKTNEQSNRNQRDGAWWTYATHTEWLRQFPFWSEKTLRRTLSSLMDSGLLIARHLMDDPRDRTLWYTIDYAVLNRTDTPAPDSGQDDGGDQSASSPPDSTLPHPCGQNDQMQMPLSAQTYPCGHFDHMDMFNLTNSDVVKMTTCLEGAESPKETPNRDNNNTRPETEYPLGDSVVVVPSNRIRDASPQSRLSNRRQNTSDASMTSDVTTISDSGVTTPAPMPPIAQVQRGPTEAPDCPADAPVPQDTHSRARWANVQATRGNLARDTRAAPDLAPAPSPLAALRIVEGGADTGFAPATAPDYTAQCLALEAVGVVGSTLARLLAAEYSVEHITKHVRAWQAGEYGQKVRVGCLVKAIEDDYKSTKNTPQGPSAADRAKTAAMTAMVVRGQAAADERNARYDADYDALPAHRAADVLRRARLKLPRQDFGSEDNERRRNLLMGAIRAVMAEDEARGL